MYEAQKKVNAEWEANSGKTYITAAGSVVQTGTNKGKKLRDVHPGKGFSFTAWSKDERTLNNQLGFVFGK